MENQKKILTRVQLINWHYFENERISLHGSTLISGENTAGKSTILDAIQLVLTTNTRKFNTAANEKGNRSLKGYVRCKIGNVGETYLRKNAVPANVALEFYEEKGERYFVIGVHMMSADEESAVQTRWYREECRLEDLSFMEGERPALAEEFKVKGKRIRFIDQKNAARDQFKRRMGNLDDKFFDIIPKSLAFKPMDNVKDFINKFVLSEAHVDVVSLRENIETLTELEQLLERSGKQLQALEMILEKYEAVEEKEHDIRVNELLLAIAGKRAREQALLELEQDLRLKKQSLASDNSRRKLLEGQLKDLEDQIMAIKVSIRENASHKLVEEAERQLEDLEKRIAEGEEKEERLQEQLFALKQYLLNLQKLEEKLITHSELEVLKNPEEDGEKNKIVEKLEAGNRRMLENLRQQQAGYMLELSKLDEEIGKLQRKQRELEKRRLQYPAKTQELKEAVEREFKSRGIRSGVHILAELLEITDPVWVNAVEGYFHTQKFYLVVEPEYYAVALEVYNKNRERIHTAGILNTGKIPLEYQLNRDSLAYVVQSENRYAKAYANYILGRVIRCERVQELEQHSIAITPECMLYQGYVVRHLNPADYRDPFIGQNAYRVQMINVKNELVEKSQSRKELRDQLTVYNSVLESAEKVNLELIKMYMYEPTRITELKQERKKAQKELEEASEDPTLIELNQKSTNKEKEKGILEEEKRTLERSASRLELQIEKAEEDQKKEQEQYQAEEQWLQQQADTDGVSYQEAEEKYQQNSKSKSARTIAENFAPQRAKYLNEKETLLNGTGGLKDLQYKFNHDFTQDFRIGMEGMSDYREAVQKLKSVEILRYEERLRRAKEDCEEIFKSDFLSKMKEYIEAAKSEFRNLNKALDRIYYGDDSYHFKISFDKKKEGLYRMITSENNQEGLNLWTSAFEAEYREEMAELFDKLMTKDDNGQKIVEEYTDYRSYLDYDIEIHKRDGSIQRFSDIYGEKSGSETQVPYYVAIAASFYQLYRYGNSVRLMLLDEAFDKMDDERILSMMDFLNGLGLQVIIANPPAKIEIIGEKVDTVLTAIRVGQVSIVEEYDF